MSSSSRTSLLDRFLGVAFTLLVSAAAIYIAVRLIEAVFGALLIIIGVLVFVGLAVVVLRGRLQRW